MADTGNLIKKIVLSQNDSEMMKRLKNYTAACTYLTQAEAKKRIQTYINCNCCYKRTLDILGSSEKSLRSAVNYANDVLKSKVGADIVDMIERGDSTAEMILDAATDYVSRPIMAEVWYNIQGYRNKTFDLKSCQKELKLLFVYSHSAMQDFKGKCDEEKLAYLKHLLTNPSSIDRRTAAILQKHLNNAKANSQQEILYCLADIDGIELID
jgi:cytochrome c551/c552